MKLYVPEIGDHIILTKDWTFDLHAESRNEQLGALFGHYLSSTYRGGWIEEEILPRLRQIDYSVDYPSYDDPTFRKMFGGFDHDALQKARKEAEDSCPEFVKYWSDHKEWTDHSNEVMKEKLIVTIPAGTTLAIDRIYIRKGASDYSSITFYAKQLGEVTVPGSKWSWGSSKSKKVKAQRFWAKLTDCNQIEFKLLSQDENKKD
jgi:hypothetical protein